METERQKNEFYNVNYSKAALQQLFIRRNIWKLMEKVLNNGKLFIRLGVH